MKTTYIKCLFVALGLFFLTHLCVAQKSNIPNNLAIPLTLQQNIISKNLQKGELVEFEVPQDIHFETGNIPAGTKAYAEVVKVNKRKVWGKPGKIVLNVTYLQIGNEKIKLKAPDIEKEGISKKRKAWTWFGVSFFYVPLNIIPPLCIKGTEAILEIGTTIIAYTIK